MLKLGVALRLTGWVGAPHLRAGRGFSVDRAFVRRQSVHALPKAEHLVEWMLSSENLSGSLQCHEQSFAYNSIGKGGIARKMDPDFDIVQLIYFIHTTNVGDGIRFERDVYDILDCSRSYNLSHDTTSALLTDGELFAQIIEGPSIAVDSLYSKTVHDGRHSRVMTLQRVLVHVRLFNFYPIVFSRVESILYSRTLNAQSKAGELRKTSIFVLKSFWLVLRE